MTDKPFDEESMLENIGGDEEMLGILLKLFTRTAESVIAELDRPEAAMAESGFDSIWQRQLHLLRGSALNIGAEELCQCLALAEFDGPTLSPAQKSARLELVKSVYARLRSYIENIRL